MFFFKAVFTLSPPVQSGSDLQMHHPEGSVYMSMYIYNYTCQHTCICIIHTVHCHSTRSNSSTICGHYNNVRVTRLYSVPVIFNSFATPILK